MLRRCCCAPEVCLVGAANINVLNDNFCRINVNLCMETKWSLWCYYGGILLAMVSIVLLVNAVALHHKTLLACEFQKRQALKAAREARRARRRRQELWEQEVYEHGTASHSSKTIQVGRSPQKRYEDEEATPPSQRGSLVVPPNSSVAVAAAATPPTPSALCASVEGKMKDLRLPTPAPRNGGEGKFSIGACTGLRCGRRGSNSSPAVEEDGRKVSSSWETRTPKNSGDVVMSWGADEEHGGGPITPKTALRFKKSAIARVMHN